MGEFYGAEESQKFRDKVSDRIVGLSDAEVSAVKARMEAVDALFADKRVVAKYKIEVQFGKGRSTWKSFAGALSLYVSGEKDHGGGDDKIYICPGDECHGIVYPRERLGSSVLCRECGTMWSEKDLIGELLFNLTPKNWAFAIQRWMLKLDLNVDVYLKYHPSDIRSKAVAEAARDHGGELLRDVRGSRALSIYPLKNIIKDTKNGASLYDQLVKFVTA